MDLPLKKILEDKGGGAQPIAPLLVLYFLARPLWSF